MSRLSRIPAALLAGFFLIPSLAWAHGVIGPRFFPATISSDDPFAADELALPTVTSFNHETDYDFDYAKSIIPGFAVGIGLGYVHAAPPDDAPASGFTNLHISPTLEVLHSPDHEFILSAGLDWEIGGSGSRAIADRFSTYTPSIKVGKGFGDLPESLGLLRPLAITATIGYVLPAAHNAFRSLAWAGAVEYNLLYLQTNVRDLGLGPFLSRLTPVVEYNFSTPMDAGATTGTINPGIAWLGQQEQITVETIIPVNHASGDVVGVIAQLHFYIDDLFPQSLGKPIFAGAR
jgi:hypothetical protein